MALIFGVLFLIVFLLPSGEKARARRTWTNGNIGARLRVGFKGKLKIKRQARFLGWVLFRPAYPMSPGCKNHRMELQSDPIGFWSLRIHVFAADAKKWKA